MYVFLKYVKYIGLLTGLPFHFTIKKKERRKRGITHMYNTNDELISSLRPSSLTERNFREDLEEIINSSKFHSDEASDTDEEKTQAEIEDHIRPKNKKETDNKHVIRVYDKPWRSKRVIIYIYIYVILDLLTFLYFLYYRSKRSSVMPMQ
jgi:hypothetical protein